MLENCWCKKYDKYHVCVVAAFAAWCAAALARDLALAAGPRWQGLENLTNRATASAIFAILSREY